MSPSPIGRGSPLGSERRTPAPSEQPRVAGVLLRRVLMHLTEMIYWWLLARKESREVLASSPLFALRRINMSSVSSFVKRINTIYCVHFLWHSQDIDKAMPIVHMDHHEHGDAKFPVTKRQA